MFLAFYPQLGVINVMNPSNHQVHSKEFRGLERSYYAMPFAERYIWGATAGMLRILYERIYSS
ncbi:MAG: hypothetical protein JSV48_27005, partial [Bradyrhizobium sp.]